jgi:hypothetical protein
MALIGRLFPILLGYLAAALTAGMILIAIELHGLSEIAPVDLNLLALVGAGFLAISGFALLRALIVFTITEAFCVGGMPAYAALGGLGIIGLAYYMGVVPNAPQGRVLPTLGIMAGTGIVAGIVYWSIAGRKAGVWRGLLRKSPPPSQTHSLSIPET